MKKIILGAIAFLGLVAVATVIPDNFSTVSTGSSLFVRSHDNVSYSVSGTFVGTVVLERSRTGGTSWETVLTIKAPQSDTINVDTHDGSAALYRFRCSAYTSGNIITQIYDADAPVISLFNSIGQPVAQITENGLQADQLVSSGSLFAGGSLIAGTGSYAGYVYIRGAAAVPNDVPTQTPGRVAMRYDTTNNSLFIYNGGWKKVGFN